VALSLRLDCTTPRNSISNQEMVLAAIVAELFEALLCGYGSPESSARLARNAEMTSGSAMHWNMGGAASNIRDSAKEALPTPSEAFEIAAAMIVAGRRIFGGSRSWGDICQRGRYRYL
jgi:hypothetical protein